MKLFGWMQHKLRPSNTEPFKDLTIGNYSTCLNYQDCHPKSTSGYGYSTLSQQSLKEFEAKGEEDSFGDKTSTVISASGLFHGFLTVGTLGSERIMSEPVTPTFTMSLEDMEEKAEVTENDLKLVNDELGRFLEAEAEEHRSNESSRRNSLVSIISLSMQEARAEEYGKTVVCPLQGYLFGSSAELQETRFQVSLAQLFYTTKIAEENPMGKCGKEEIQTKQTNKPVKHLINKILKKFHASPKQTSSFSTKKKLQKCGLQIIKLFHRKIHPESSIAERESKKNNAHYNVDDYTKGEQFQQAKDNIWFPQGSRSKAGLGNKKTVSKMPQYGLTGCAAASENGEHWINADADYLVLEL